MADRGRAAAGPPPPAASSSQRRSNSGATGNGEAAAAATADPPLQTLQLSEGGEGGEVRCRPTAAACFWGRSVDTRRRWSEPLRRISRASEAKGSKLSSLASARDASRPFAHLQVYEAIHYEGDPQQSGHIVTTACNRGGTRHILRYVAERIVGNGSFGVVFQATCLETKETVAIKRVLQDKRFKNRELQIMR